MQPTISVASATPNTRLSPMSSYAAASARQASPHRFLSPGGASPLHHQTLTSLGITPTRSFGTPTSDIRGTSPGEEEEEVLDEFQAPLQPESLPKPIPGYPLGSTRCYWSILDDDLRFVYIDPILQFHMGAEASLLLGTSIYSYLHPDEKEQAIIDLERSASAGTHRSREESVGSGSAGSRSNSTAPQPPGQAPRRRWELGGVTRCRFARSSYIRRLLGCEAPEVDAEAHKYTLDEQFMPLKMVMSSVGSNLVLCFFHAVLDKDPIADNQEHEPRPAWTAWCGPRDVDPTEFYFDDAQAQMLETALLNCQSTSGVGELSGDEEKAAPSLVFQILRNPGGEVLFSYPPALSASGDKSHGGNNDSPSFGEPRYLPDEYAALAVDVCRRPKESNVAAKTNCTRRLKSKHPVVKEGTLTSIESIVIQYGTIAFAFFQTGGVFLSRSAASSNANVAKRTMQPPDRPAHSRKRQRTTSQLAGKTGFDPLGSLIMPWDPAVAGPLSGGELSPTMASAASVLGSFQNAQYSPSTTSTSLPSGDITTSSEGHGYDAFGLQHLAAMAMGQLHGGGGSITTSANHVIPHQRQQRSHGHSASVDLAAHSLLGIGQGFEFPNKPEDSIPGQSAHIISGGAAVQVGPSTTLPRPVADSALNEMRSRAAADDAGAMHCHVNSNASPVQLSGAGGDKACSSCGTTNSPEWRKGPSGIKSLCNACGLRFSRAQARKAKLQKAAEAKKAGLPPPESEPKAPKKAKTGSRQTKGGIVADANVGMTNSGVPTIVRPTTPLSNPPTAIYDGQEGDELVDSIPVPSTAQLHAQTNPLAGQYAFGMGEAQGLAAARAEWASQAGRGAASMVGIGNTSDWV